jgi:hypothetical protein
MAGAGAGGRAVIALPRTLAPWAPQLELFPEELALALGATVAKLAQLLGGFSSGRVPEGEPDGYDGIAQRGPYERLLPTQWLLLDELPDEFLRRVVAGEHAFLRRAHAGRGAQRRCVALFDAGIDQLGAPRIGQLALLVVLAQRALLAGATFEWGVLQDSSRSLHPAIAEGAVRSLLAARSSTRVTPAELTCWLDAQHGPRTSELWLIGAPGLRTAVAGHPAAAHAAFVALDDVLEPGGPQRIHVRAELPWRSRPAELVLELPEERLAARLLREPFGSAAAGTTGRMVSSSQLDPSSTPVFSPDGRRLYARARDGGLVSMTVQSSLNAPAARPVVFHPPAGQTIFAVSRYEKRTVALAYAEPGTATAATAAGASTTIVAHMLSKRGAGANGSYRFVSIDGYLPAPSLARTPLRPLGVFSADHFGFLDDEGDVVELVVGKLKRAVAAKAFAATAIRGRLVWASQAGGTPRVAWAGGAGQYLSALEIGDSVARNQLIASAAAGSAVQQFHFGRPFTELVALSSAPGDWSIIGKSIERLFVPPPRQVVGVVEFPRDERAALLVLDSARCQLDALSTGASVTLVTTRAPITQVAVSSSAHEIAYLTSRGELGVYSTARGMPVLSIVEEGAK